MHDEIGPEKLHTFIGQEPSGRLFNEICLDYNSVSRGCLVFSFIEKPHNPLINAGAIVVTSLMKMGVSLSDRFDFVSFPSYFRNKFQAIRQMRRFCGTGYVGFNNSVFLSERETADRNYALSYYMREHGVSLVYKGR